MHYSIISQRIKRFLHNGERFFGFIDWFCNQFQVEQLLESYGCGKKKGVDPIEIFKYLVSLPFYNITYTTDMKKKITGVPFKKDTVRRFLKNPKADWIGLTSELSLRILSYLRPDFDQKTEPFFFIIDDTDYQRPHSNYVDEISWQYNHVNGKVYKGFKLDALSFYYCGVLLPISGVFVSSANQEKILHKTDKVILESQSSKRRNLARNTGLNAMFEQLKQAKKVGFPSGYVLFDSWYTHPKTVYGLLQKGFDVIGMLKANGRTRFRFEGKWLTVREIFQKLSQGKAVSADEGIFFSTIVDFRTDQHLFPVKLVFAENVNKGRDYVCIASTDLTLEAQAVISYYRYRFSLETIFKDIKNPTLRLLNENRGLNLDNISGHLAIVLVRYMIILTEMETDSNSANSIFAQTQKLAQEERTVDCVNTGLDIAKKILDTVSENAKIPIEILEDWSSDALAQTDEFLTLWNNLPDCAKT